MTITLRRLLIVVLLLTTGSATAVAQQQLPQLLQHQLADPTTRVGQSDVAWCLTPHLMNSEEGQAALDRYHKAASSGTLPGQSLGQASAKSFQIGSQQIFNIIEDSTWTSGSFEVVTVGNGWRAWMRTDVGDQQIIVPGRLEQMRISLDEQTPDPSINPSKGVFENDREIFGQTPVYPLGSDGTVDILIYELPPGTAGFVSPSDYDPRAADTVGNQGETLYLEIDNFFNTGSGVMESVIAHELQHLIHIRYDTRETSFVNEGLSEFAQQINGYPVVPAVHLWGPRPEYNTSLFGWRGLNSLDYTRGALWTGYMAERLGAAVVGAVTRSDRTGLEGYQAVLDSIGSPIRTEDLVLDFHSANFINDKVIDARFGYELPQRSSELGLLQLPRNRKIDGSDQTSISLDSIIVQAGGADYLIFENVKDLSLKIDVKANADQIENRRTHMRIRAVAEDLDGAVSVHEFAPGEQPKLLKGSFSRVRLILAHVRPEAPQLRTTLEAMWTDDPDHQVTSIRYSTDTARPGAGPFAISTDGSAAVATRFEPPPGSALDRVALSTYYLNNFSGGDPLAPRDFELVVWASDGSGKPGEMIYSQHVDDPRVWLPVAFTGNFYVWFDVRLSPAFEKGTTTLPDTVFIGIQDTGSDDNYMVVWPSPFRGSPAFDTGFIRAREQSGAFFWIPLWDVTFEGGEPGSRPLNRTALPIEARFVVDNRPVAVESSLEIPRRLELDQNYPNPFNPSTRVTFALPEASNVKLDVYDISGRRIVSLLNGVQAAGSYTVTVDATAWSSGVYFYKLTAGSEQVTRRMVLMK